MITKAPRGTKDWFGEEMEQRTYLEKIFRELCARCNIHEVITPVFEHTELFQRGVGETTDVVQKEMYTFLDKGNRSISLKPEGTAGADPRILGARNAERTAADQTVLCNAGISL